MLVVSEQHESQLQKICLKSIEHFFVFSTTANLFGAEIGVAEIWQASKIVEIITKIKRAVIL
jgi:hypothetical protein